MPHPEEDLNTESNDIAGNRINGPIGNTAARPGAPGTGTGIPGGPPAPAATADVSSSTAPASSGSLAASETGAGQGAAEPTDQPQENKPADPAALMPDGAYGGNFSNSTQGSYHDQDRRDNQDSDPNRGEFGAQDLGGTTHGGYGNQNRLADYEPRDSAEDRYYGGSGAPGPQDNAYRDYDGQDQRPDVRTAYGFERGTAGPNPSGQAADQGQPRGDRYDGPNADNRNQPDRADANSAHQVDNGSAIGPDRGFAADYGHTSLPDAAPHPKAAVEVAGRNQTEDYLPAQAGSDKQGRREEQHPGYSTNAPEMADQRGQRPPESQGYGDRGRDEPRRSPDFATGDARNGYVDADANRGNADKGIGSRGGSYNDANEDSRPGSTTGSPVKGEERSEDRDRNYGSEARQENRADGDDSPDHDAPRRNVGRDGEGDE